MNSALPLVTNTLRGRLRPSTRQIGLTLIELMIALSLGLLLIAVVGSIFVGSSQTYRVQENSARIQENGRYALEIIGRSLRQAGADAPMTANPVAASLRCVTPACTAIAGTGNTLTLQLYAGMDEVNAGAWGSRDCTGRFVNSGTLITNAFALNGSDLRCTGSVGGALPLTQPLVSNIADFQIIYGVDNDGSSDQSADLYTAAPTAAQWPNVVTARVCVVVVSDPTQNQGLSVGNQRYQNCAGALGTASGAAAFTTAADTRLRRTFVATFNLRNRVSLTP